MAEQRFRAHDDAAIREEALNYYNKPVSAVVLQRLPATIMIALGLARPIRRASWGIGNLG